MSQFKITPITALVAGALTTQYVVTAEDGSLIGKKAHKSEADAQAEVASLAGYGEGLAYAAANGITGKNAVGKANLIAEYLAWVELGRPVKAAEPAAPEAPAAEGNGESF